MSSRSPCGDPLLAPQRCANSAMDPCSPCAFESVLAQSSYCTFSDDALFEIDRSHQPVGITLDIKNYTFRRNDAPFVGQPIVAAAGFQPALFVS
jgi:hypothetical protein